MTRFSANLGFLWADLPLPNAIRAASAAGFDAVECHWPYDCPASEVAAALADTGLPMLSLNTRRGDVAAGENGLAALPGRETEARTAIDEALGYAIAIGAQKVHVMAGVATGTEARRTFLSNLSYACAKSAPHGIAILIEPLNAYDAPGYFLTTTEQAVSIIDSVAADNLALMFDCYHVQIMEGNLTRKLSDLLPVIGHVQVASVPDRGTPDHGELNYIHIFRHLAELGYTGPLGAEYRPIAATGDTLDWLEQMSFD